MSRTVCHLRPSRFFGGPEKQIMEHCLRLDPRVWKPCVASFRERRESVELLETAKRHGLDTLMIDTASNYSPRAVSILRHELAVRRVDVLMCHGYRADLLGRLACLGSAVHQIAVVRGYTREMARVKAYEWLDRRVLRGVDRVVAVSAGTKRMLVGSGIRSASIEVVHNGVTVPAESQEPAPLRTELAIPADVPLIAAAGRLSPEKGHLLLVRSARMMADRNVKFRLAILGEGRERAALERAIVEHRLEERVHLLGFRDDVLASLAAADVVVNPSQTEGSPNVILEAMSLARPVVATAVGGVPEMLDHGKTGLLVRSGDAADLSHQLSQILADPERGRAIGSAAREVVRERFSFEALTRELVRIYESVVARQRTPRTAFGGAAR